MSSQFSPPDEGLIHNVDSRSSSPLAPHLSQLKHASTSRVRCVHDLDRLVIPALRQLLHFNPQLQLSAQLAPTIGKASRFGKLLLGLVSTQI